MSNPLYVAIDTPHLDEAVELIKKIKAHVGGVKLGLEFSAQTVITACMKFTSWAYRFS